MKLQLNRIDSGTDSTIGSIHIVEGMIKYLECFSCEDEQRVAKVNGKTRIDAGRYEIILRTEGGMHAEYLEMFDFHEGMLWLQNVNNFEWVYIHVGNTHKNTLGCILAGSNPVHNYADGGGHVTSSINAYTKLYKKVVDSLKHERVFIEIRDEI